MLYKRYPNADGFLNRAFKSGKLVDGINQLVEKANDEQLYDLWSKRCFDKSFEEFKAGIMKTPEIHKVEKKETTEIINQSFNILDTFIPS